jgi:hypothetical protein
MPTNHSPGERMAFSDLRLAPAARTLRHRWKKSARRGH